MPLNSKTERWIYGLINAAIGGGAGAIVSGVSSMGFAPDKFNLTDWNGILRLLGLMAVNFLFSAILSIAFYLKQSPLPPLSTETTETTYRSKDESTGKIVEQSSSKVVSTPVVTPEPPPKST